MWLAITEGQFATQSSRSECAPPLAVEMTQREAHAREEELQQTFRLGRGLHRIGMGFLEIRLSIRDF